MTFMSLDNSPFLIGKQKNTLKMKESRSDNVSASRIDSTVGFLMIQAYINSPTPASGIDLTKSVYFNYKILSQEIDTLKAHANQNRYNADSLGFRIHFAKYDTTNTTIKSYLSMNHKLELGGRNTVVIQVTHKGMPAYYPNGHSVYLNMGDLCPRNCPN
jgi:hypothetical protein